MYGTLIYYTTFITFLKGVKERIISWCCLKFRIVKKIQMLYWIHFLPRSIHNAYCLNYKVVQIWPGQTVACLHTISHGHIWTTLYIVPRVICCLLRVVTRRCWANRYSEVCNTGRGEKYKNKCVLGAWI
jgi:hypothetical protein